MDYQRIIANTNRDNSFMRHNGILLTQMEKDRAVVEADLTETGIYMARSTAGCF